VLVLNATRRFRHSGEIAALTRAENNNVRRAPALSCSRAMPPPSLGGITSLRPHPGLTQPLPPAQRIATVRKEFDAQDQSKVHSLVTAGDPKSATVTEEQLAGAPPPPAYPTLPLRSH